MSRHDEQRKADAAERARLKAEEKEAREERMAAAFKRGDELSTIAAAFGACPQHVADVLERHGLRKQKAKPGRPAERRTFTRALRKVRAHGDT
jgi:hypothetical protein